MNNSLVSIIVPVYKVERFIQKCIRSIINQSYPNIEIILVDDGSPDKCPQICDKLAEEDTKIKVIHKKNEGVTKARIEGFKASEGEYVFFVDADDTLEAYAIEELLKNSQKYDADISICQVNILYDNKIIPQFRNVKYGYYSKEDIINLLGRNFLYDEKTNRSGIPLYLWGKLYKRKLLIDKLETGIGFWYGEDMITIFSVIKESNNMYISDKPLYNYVQNPSQVTQKPFINLFPQYVKIWQYFEDTDVESYLKTQLPRRMWLFITKGLNESCKKEKDYQLFKRLFYLIRNTPIVLRQISKSNLLYLQTPTSKILYFCFKKSIPWLYYFLVKNNIIIKLRRIIKLNKNC